MSVLILLKDKHIYTDIYIYAYLEIYENVEVTPIMTACHGYIDPIFTTIDTLYTNAHTLSTNALTLGTTVPQRFRFHTRLKSIHE